MLDFYKHTLVAGLDGACLPARKNLDCFLMKQLLTTVFLSNKCQKYNLNKLDNILSVPLTDIKVFVT